MQDEFSLSSQIDADELKSRFLQFGRAEIPCFLGPGQAEMLRTWLRDSTDWTLVLNAGSKVYEIPRSGYAELTPAQREELDRRVITAGRDGFQYRYEAIRVPDGATERFARNSLLDRYLNFMCSPPVLNLLSHIVGADDIAFADGQATAYSAGHFLTRHDDDVAGKQRRAAYVLGLNPDWLAEWGGLLMFHSPDGCVRECFTPAMGALRIFTVPSLHSVSYVTPFAPEPRISVTGWLRA